MDKDRDAERKGNWKSLIPIASRVGFLPSEKRNSLCILDINTLSSHRVKRQACEIRIHRIDTVLLPDFFVLLY